MSGDVSKYILNPCGWFDVDYVEIGAADTFGFTEFIVLEKGSVKRKYLPERICRPIEQVCTTLPGTDCPAWECSACGELFEEGARYCSSCGAKVVAHD